MNIRLASIPDANYAAYRYDVIFKAYKWDPQVSDHNTIAKQAVILSRETASWLESQAEALSQETVLMENALLKHPELLKQLGLPKRLCAPFRRGFAYDPARHVRLMRFDFHPTPDGWAVSEVNSDVPGGLAEASVLPKLAAAFFPGTQPGPSVGERLWEAFKDRLEGRRVAFVHATSYADDRQVMQFLGDYFCKQGCEAIYAAPEHIAWENRKAVGIDGIVRFYPMEWFVNLPRSINGYFDGETPACNPPAAILTQSKRLPLVWDRLDVDIPAWRSLLPETADPKVSGPAKGWIYKPALGRVGEGISIQEAVSVKESRLIEKAARRHPRDWVAQRRFESRPLTAQTGESLHLGVGVFTVNGRSAGFYGRVNPYPRIDANAKDIPVLIEGTE